METEIHQDQKQFEFSAIFLANIRTEFEALLKQCEWLQVPSTCAEAANYALFHSGKMRRAPRFGITPETILDLAYLIFVVGLVGCGLLFRIFCSMARSASVGFRRPAASFWDCLPRMGMWSEST